MSDARPAAGPGPYMNAADWSMLLGLAAIWGTSFFFIAVAVPHLPPLTLSALRVLLAAITLWCVVVVAGVPRPPSPRTWMAFGVMGLLNNAVPFTLIIWAQARVPSGLAAILIASTPLFGVLAAGVALRDERITALKLAGVAAGFAGVVLMIGHDALHGLGGHVAGILACLAAAASLAVAGVFGRRFRELGVDPVMTATAQVSASSLLLIPLALVFDAPWTLPVPGSQVWLAVFALAVLSTAFAYLLYFRILASAGATNLLLVNFLVPVPAILLGTVVLGERLGLMHLAGLALIGAGLSAVDGRLWRRQRPA